MLLLKSILAILYATSVQQILAFPVDEATDIQAIAPRQAAGTGNRQNDPIKIDFFIGGESRLPFDADCYAILCLKRSRVL